MRLPRYQLMTWFLIALIASICGLACAIGASHLLFSFVGLGSVGIAGQTEVYVEIQKQILYTRRVNDAFWNVETMSMLSVPFAAFLGGGLISVCFTTFIVNRLKRNRSGLSEN